MRVGSFAENGASRQSLVTPIDWKLTLADFSFDLIPSRQSLVTPIDWKQELFGCLVECWGCLVANPW